MNHFGLFSTEHLLSIGGYTLFYGVLLFISQFFSKKSFRLAASSIIIIVKAAELIIRHGVYGETVLELIPIHLCNVTLILAVISMVFPSKRMFQVIYYWGFGAVAAILFPDSRVAFPNFVGISFFVTHFFILFTVWYQLIYFKFRPSLQGLFQSFIWINIFAGIVFKINQMLGTNYMYINYKPAFQSPLDFFGPWPNYIVVVEIIYIVLGIIGYLPFRKKGFKYSNI